MKLSLKAIAGLLLLVVCLTVSANAQSNIFNLVVKESKAENSNGKQYLSVKYNNSADWEPFYADIANFDYQEGYRYHLKVKRTKVDNGSGYTYALNRLIKKQKIKSSQTNNSSNVVKAFGDIDWKLIQMNGKEVNKFIPTIKFDTDKGSVYGTGGCNRYFGEYKVTGGKISFSKMGVSMMHCGDEAMKSEREYHDLLNETNLLFKVNRDKLECYNDNKLVLVFAKESKK